MERRRSSSSYHGHRYQYNDDDEMGEIKKGPWKAEEDEVLINHVKKYGPRDWSSIRSKGLLQRTGKSCRLRWVNKLRPNLKNGVKFSAEEERTVIELQGQFGNKWARIATYLPGRTDNDVKNFWSSRQKRLARILRTSAPQPGKSQNNKNSSQTSAFQESPPVEAPKFSSSTEPEESLSKSQQSCSSSYIGNSDMINVVPLPDLVNPNSIPFESNLLQLDFTPTDQKKLGIIESHIQTDFALPLENQEFPMPSFIDVFGHEFNGSELDNVQVPLVPCAEHVVKREIEKALTPDTFIDDFPLDMFDHIEPLPSPSEW
ncbi:transcription factor DUO1-like [Lycium ferocissimum]|uniref:transcription factor DUO1-like n=1 Tax=Lycium ferocissimum TaxID=112874 RepID=UPI002815FC1F|nr:transcription factor DUO1-like [Lycium ferocissimum]